MDHLETLAGFLIYSLAWLLRISVATAMKAFGNNRPYPQSHKVKASRWLFEKHFTHLKKPTRYFQFKGFSRIFDQFP